MFSTTAEEMATTSITSATQPLLECAEFQGFEEDFNDHGDNWANNEDPLPVQPITEIEEIHTSFTVVDSMDQKSGYTHYLLESNQGMLFHGHEPTHEWALILAKGIQDGGKAFVELSERSFVYVDRLYPMYDQSMTRFSGDTQALTVFTKEQPILSQKTYNTPHYARCTFQEVKRCERILRSPHRNLAKYLGAVTKRIEGEDRVVRIAYRRYTMDLHEFVIMKRLLRSRHVPFILRSLKRAIHHLHRLGLVHCDVRPPNIFVSFDKHKKGSLYLTEVVLGDFDASLEIGEKVALKRANGDWWPQDVGWGDKANASIDEHSLRKLKTWLNVDGLGKSPWAEEW
ncbi:hypothetical protein C7974DRAFT_425173 [Boeremia exigua]|uniref:uncharacterized protein n=1 Tax=Boeremia exigua TaxID=749465 RepID=UPI001E8CBEB7|nr:uncharacterized protein C7974DRAFT_425173 [Boeremia exigua]KAH6625527.1 hypothetical protein C7974DRAFT_425173 [Boeremia exigua]